MTMHNQNLLGFLLTEESYQVVVTVAVNEDITEYDALNSIIREWSSSKEIEPVNSTQNRLI